MTELVTTRIHDHATRLGLPHLAEHLETLVDRAEADTMGYREFVDLLLGEELGLREGRRLRTALKLSGLPHHKTLDEFDFAFQPDLDPRKVRDLAALPFLPRHSSATHSTASNVALLGPPGTGKTHIAVALAVAACQAGYSIYFTTSTTASASSAPPKLPAATPEKLQTYLRPSVLVLDEVGYLPCDRAAANMVFQLISRRYERGTIILTSNKANSRVGTGLHRRGPGHRHPRPAAPPLRRRRHQRPQLPTQRPDAHPRGSRHAIVTPRWPTTCQVVPRPTREPVLRHREQLIQRAGVGLFGAEVGSRSGRPATTEPRSGRVVRDGSGP